MGLHTGEATPTPDGDYTSLEVHRAARIAAAGHGGQVLVSETTRALVSGMLPADVTIRDLGEHRLKDLRPERLSQLVAAGLPADFPPIRSLDRRPNNLPTQLTSFVGRDDDLATTLLLDASRLLTLTGPGGIGKTRLALQLAAAAADRYPDGIWFVPLEPLREAELVPGTIARAVGLADGGVRPTMELLVEHLARRTCLLVLDNFEQVIAAAPLAAQLLRACPNLTIVTTSRGALHVSGEQEYAVPGLPAPPDQRHLSTFELARLPAEIRAADPATLNQYEAVRLFVARALAVRADFRVTNENAPAVAGICATLQGLPLAIALAAARVKVLAPDAILERLEHRLELLASASRDLPERQRTLRGAIAWSYDLLDDAGRRLLARLAVFVGGCDLAMIEEVCDPGAELGVDLLEVLATLVDQSLVRSDDIAGSARFSLLDTIRTYGAERLDASGEGPAIRERHLAAYLELAERAAAELSGPAQRTWLDRLEADAYDFRAALDRAEAIPRSGGRRPARVRALAVLATARLSPRGAPAAHGPRSARLGPGPANAGPPAGGARRRRVLAGRRRGLGSVVRGGPGDLAHARRPAGDRQCALQPRLVRRRGAARGRIARGRVVAAPGRTSMRRSRTTRQSATAWDRATSSGGSVASTTSPRTSRRQSAGTSAPSSTSARRGIEPWRPGRSTCWAPRSSSWVARRAPAT